MIFDNKHSIIYNFHNKLVIIIYLHTHKSKKIMYKYFYFRMIEFDLPLGNKFLKHRKYIFSP
jgi:hypothetical protein